MKHLTSRWQSRTQDGVASLVVVMVLFLIVAMVAAYTNRNLIFEQRTSVNQYRSTQALEAAEAGIEWAKAMLNQGRISASCQPSTSVGDTTFRQRYLAIDGSGSISPVVNSTPGVGALTAACVRNGTTWDCDCPSTGTPSLTVTSNDINPAFRVRFVGGVGQPGLVRLESNGCTRWDPANCLNFTGQGLGGEGRVLVTELIGLTPALASTPMATLTAGGAVNLNGASATIYNADLPSGGWTIQARGAIAAPSPNNSLISLPGTPGSASILDSDVTLPATADRMFTDVFNMWPGTYRDQPGTVLLDSAVAGCGGSGCTASAVRTAQSLNPGRMIWVAGDLTIDSAGDIGSLSEPALIVVNGDLTFTTNATIFGAVYVRSGTWTGTGAGQVRGALVAQNDVTGTMSTTMVYDASVLKLLRVNTGSFVAVPGGWKDYCNPGAAPSTTACP